MPFIAGAGRINIDLLYANLKKLPESGEEVYTDSFSLQLGGGVPASLVWLSRLGIETHLATALGSDIFSDFADKELKKHNTKVFRFPCESNPVNITSALILKEDRSFVTYGSCEFTADDESRNILYTALHGAKICLMSPGGFCDVYEKLKKEGTILLLDFGWDSGMSFEKYERLFSLADYYLPNSREAMKLTSAATPNEAAQALSEKLAAGVVKCGSGGAIGFKGGQLTEIPALPHINSVDSTGAGDAFLAGFAYGLYYDYDFTDCIKFGNITGARAVEHVGALSAEITEAELLERKKEYDKNITTD